jgi:hypothetical protein
MRRVFVLGLLTLALPMAAFANTANPWTDFESLTNGSLVTGGSIISLNVGVTAMNGFNGGGLFGGSFGTMSFTTGALISSVHGVETFGRGGSFEITGNGIGGLPDGVIFKGTFSGAVKESIIGGGTDPQNQFIQLTCASSKGCLNGTWYNGKSVTGILIVDSGGGVVNASASFQPSAVPEPGALSMLGTGLLGLGALVRRKLKA